MNGVKASCVGPTFALARCSDSATGSKKSRRQSKEDRKALVVTFIKKYQNSNNGNFPSLSLTQKEVGGSFYKVREIVREVIQENRVLGPAKLTPDEQNNDIVSEQYPLGSISTETVFVSAEETHIVSKDDKSIKEELLSTVNGLSIGQHQQVVGKAGYDIEVLVDGAREEGDAGKSSAHVNDELLHEDSQTSHVVEKKVEIVETSGSTYDIRNVVNEEGKESDANKSVHLNHDMLHTDVKTAHKAEKKLDLEEASISKVTPLATDVIVETFPMKPAAKVTKVGDGKPESKDLTRTLEDNEVKELVSAAEKPSSTMHRMNIMEMESSHSCDEKSTENHTDPSFPKIAPNGTMTLTENITANKTTSTGESVSQEELVMETQADIQHSQSSEEGKRSTLNRMNLESWEGAIKKPAVNPVLAVFKAFITSFVKFWLE